MTASPATSAETSISAARFCRIPSTHSQSVVDQNASISVSHITLVLETRKVGVNSAIRLA